MSNLLPTLEARAAYYKRLVENLIHENERQFIYVALSDFHEGLRTKKTAQEELDYCKLWVKVYQPGTVSA